MTDETVAAAAAIVQPGSTTIGKQTSPNSQIALGADVATALYGVTGAGYKIGVISDSFNATGGAGRDIANGDLPANVTVLSDLTGTGNDDEGRAMMELVHQVAPSAQLYFATGAPDIDACAQAVDTLVSAGCNIIIDDLGFSDESYFQVGTKLDLAIMNAVGKGVDYFSAAGNDGKKFYENTFAPLQLNLNGTIVTATDFGAGNAKQSWHIGKGATFQIMFQWAQPFKTIGDGSKSAQNSMGLYLLDANGNVVESETGNRVGSNPFQGLSFSNKTSSTQFYLVVTQNGGTIPTGEQFKFLFSGGTTDDPNVNKGSGNMFGHELLTDQNSIAAVDWEQTPAFGVSPPQVEGFSSVGPGSLLFDMNGNPLPQPVDTAMPTFAAPDGSDTAVPGFAPFGGTSAAAPNAGATAALVLQANSLLTTMQLTAVLAQSGIPTASPPGVNDSGAGLIQARAAVEIAVADAGVRWSSAGGGTWANAGSWSTGIVPNSDQAVILGDNFGVLTAGYTVHLASGLATAAALAITGVGTNTVTLALSGGSLTVAGAGSSVITRNDFLVSRGGSLSITGGTLITAGTLNVNAGAVSLAGGDASAGAFAQDAGSLTIGGNALSAATLNLQGANPGEATFGQTGGLVDIANHGTVSLSSGSVSGGTLDVASDGSVSAAGSLTVFNSALVNNAGTMSESGLLSVIDSGTVTTDGTLATDRVILAAAQDTDTPPVSPPTVASLVENGGTVIVGATGSTGTNFVVNAGGAVSLTSASLTETGTMDIEGGNVSLTNAATAATGPIEFDYGTVFITSSTLGTDSLIVARPSAFPTTTIASLIQNGGSVIVGKSSSTGANFVVNQGGVVSLTFASLTETGTMSVAGGGTLSLASATLHTAGSMNIEGGTVLLSNTAATTTGPINVNSGSISISAGNLTTTDTITVAGTSGGFSFTTGTVASKGFVQTGAASSQIGVSNTQLSALLLADTFQASGGNVSIAQGSSVIAGSGLLANSAVHDSGLFTTSVGLIVNAGGSLDILSGGQALDGGNLTGDGAGTVTILGTLAIAGTMSGTAIKLAHTGARLSLSASDSSTLLTGYTAAIKGLDQSGTGVDFSRLAFSGGEHAVVNGTTLSLLGTGGPLATLQVDPFPTYDLTVVNDGSGHPLVETAPCFVAGSRILTNRGEVAVEDLREGDVVVTASGRPRPICWIGHRRIDPARHPCPRTVQPIRIQRGAFAANTPHRDLLLSPDHAVFVEGVLVPVRYLVNGATIRCQTVRRPITYYHVELDGHDILLAEGLAVESFLDTGCRQDFDNGGAVVALHPDFSTWAWEARGYAPLVVAGPEIGKTRRRLAQRARAMTGASGRRPAAA